MVKQQHSNKIIALFFFFLSPRVITLKCSNIFLFNSFENRTKKKNVIALVLAFRVMTLASKRSGLLYRRKM